MACLTGSFAGMMILELVGNCCMLAGDMALLGRVLQLAILRSFLAILGETRSSFPPDVPIEKWLRIEVLLPFSGDV